MSSANSFWRGWRRDGPEPAYLFLGPEAFERTRCRRALLDAVLPPEERENGFTRHDLDRTPLAAALDDARALSLFASRRLIWLAGAEAAVPRASAPALAAKPTTKQTRPEPVWPHICESQRPDVTSGDRLLALRI